MRGEGLEPTPFFKDQDLNLARMPIPPPSQGALSLPARTVGRRRRSFAIPPPSRELPARSGVQSYDPTLLASTDFAAPALSAGRGRTIITPAATFIVWKGRRDVGRPLAVNRPEQPVRVVCPVASWQAGKEALPAASQHGRNYRLSAVRRARCTECIG